MQYRNAIDDLIQYYLHVADEKGKQNEPDYRDGDGKENLPHEGARFQVLP